MGAMRGMDVDGGGRAGFQRLGAATYGSRKGGDSGPMDVISNVSKTMARTVFYCVACRDLSWAPAVVRAKGSMASYDHMLKLLLVGDSGVGKSSLIVSYASHEFSEEMKSTIGVDLKMKHVCLKDKTLKLTIWDTAGQERFRTLTSAYYRGAHGVILAYDVTRRESFEHIQEWLKEVNLYSTNEDVVKMVIANKIDLEHDRVVSTDEGRQFAREHAMLFLETSAKTQQGVQQAFEELLLQILDIPSLLAPPTESVAVEPATEDACPC